MQQMQDQAHGVAGGQQCALRIRKMQVLVDERQQRWQRETCTQNTARSQRLSVTIVICARRRGLVTS